LAFTLRRKLRLRELGGITTTLEAYVWHFVGGIDVILGVVWLETSGTITMDWKAVFMKFVHEGKPVQL
jgi:uncharacterized membrane protein (Fun14 family)